MSTPSPVILGVGGTLRDGSTSQKARQLACICAGRFCAVTGMFAGPALDLKPFDPKAPA
jgi:FMN reductase